MMKLFFYLILFCIHLFGNDALLINEDFKYDLASKNMYFIKDKTNLVNIETIEQVEWQKVINTNLGGINQFYSWTKFNLKNVSNSSKNIILKNPRAGIDEIDVYLIANNQIVKKMLLGDNRDIKLRDIIHRYSVLSINLEPNQEYTVVSRIINRIGGNDCEWEIYDSKEFFSFSMLESMWWGLYGGLTLALLVYSIPTLMAVRDLQLAIYFGCYAVSSLLYQYALNGILYSFGYSPSIINETVLLLGALFGLFSTLVLYRFFLIGNFSKILILSTKIIIIGIAINIFIAIGSFFSSQMLTLTAYYSVYIALLGYISWFLLLKQIFSASREKIYIYIFSGYTAIFLSYFALVLVTSGVLPNNDFSVYGVSIGSAFEMLFFTFAISEYIERLKFESFKKDRLIDFQMRFSSVGKVIGNISHQWKVPLVRLGSLITEIEASLIIKNDLRVLTDVNEILPKMRNNLEFMGKTIDEFHSLYKSKDTKSVISLNEVILDVWGMLNAKAISLNAKMNIINNDVKIESFKHLIMHVLMIVMDNFLEMAQKRNIVSAEINISVNIEETKIFIILEDNCGGISQKPIDTIFKQGISCKEATNFSGLGLYIAKNIVVDKIKGSIDVENTEKGAKFIICFFDAN